MQAVVCVNRYRHLRDPQPSEEAPEVALGSAPEAPSAPAPAEAPVAQGREIAEEESDSSSDEVWKDAISQEELRGFQVPFLAKEILESSEEEEEQKEAKEEVDVEPVDVESEAVSGLPEVGEETLEEAPEELEDAEEVVEEAEVVEVEAVPDDNATSAASVEAPEAGLTEVDASELSSDSEGNELDLEDYDYEISNDDDEDMVPVDVSDDDEDFDFDDFDGEEDFEDDLDLEDYEEEEDLAPLKQGFGTWLALKSEELPQRLAQPGAAQKLRERLLEELRKETGSQSTVEVNRFCLQWEHSLVFDDCPPLLGFVSKKDAEKLLHCPALADLKLKFGWSEEVQPATASTEPASPSPSYPTREIRMDRSRSRDRSTTRPWDSSMSYFEEAKSSPRTSPRIRQLKTHPRCKDIFSFPDEFPKVTLEKNGVLVVYKPAFWTMTTCQDSERIISRYSALQDWIRKEMGDRYNFLYTNDRAGLIHRLDVQTSGPIICGATLKAFKELRQCLHVHKFYKEYIALMHGALPVRQCCGEMDYPLMTQRERGYAGWHTSVDPYGQKALTRYEAVAAYKYSEGHGKTQRYTLVRLQLITGKTHQIRVHLMELARRNNLKTHGIVGDYKYLPPRSLKLDKRICRRVFLHCYRLHFPMPNAAKDADLCKVRCPLPSELQNALSQIDLDKDLTENYRKQCRRHRVMDCDDMIDPKQYLNIPGLVDYDFWREETGLVTVP